jgi:hypothetical protein
VEDRVEDGRKNTKKVSRADQNLDVTLSEVCASLTSVLATLKLWVLL